MRSRYVVDKYLISVQRIVGSICDGEGVTEVLLTKFHIYEISVLFVFIVDVK